MAEYSPRVIATWVLLAANVAVFFWMVTARGVDARVPTVEQLTANGASSSRLARKSSRPPVPSTNS